MNYRYDFQMAGATDTGQMRTSNEDNFFCSPVGGDRRYTLAVAADGVGGYHGGSQAAEIAVTQLPQMLDAAGGGDITPDVFFHAVRQTNNLICDRRDENPSWSRMSCVLTAGLFDAADGCMYLAHVGDSRLYAFLDNRLVKVSKDHSPVGYEEELGAITETEAMAHPFRNVISRTAGDECMDADGFYGYFQTAVLPVGQGITYLFASDGLFDMITSAEIITVLGADTSLDEKVSALIAAANAAGGRDNITVVLVRDTVLHPSDGMRDARIMDLYAHYARHGYRDVPVFDDDVRPQGADDLVQADGAALSAGQTENSNLSGPVTDIPVDDNACAAGIHDAADDDNTCGMCNSRENDVMEGCEKVTVLGTEADGDDEVADADTGCCLEQALDFSLVVEEEEDHSSIGLVRRNRRITCLLACVTGVILLLLGAIVWSGIEYRRSVDFPQYDYSWHDNLYYNALKITE